MEWTGEAIVLGARPFSEAKAIAEVFARTEGRCAGVVHAGRRSAPVLQAGNRVQASWRARLAEQLGTFQSIELLEPYAALALADPAALAGLASAIALVRGATAERQPYPGLYDGLCVFLESLAEADLWPAVYARFELGLLAAMGYGLDLGECALTGALENLAWVSPKTGRAACAEAGAPYAGKLLRLPPFLTRPEAELESGDVADALALSGYFLERRVFDARGEGAPPARGRLIHALGMAGRL